MAGRGEERRSDRAGLPRHAPQARLFVAVPLPEPTCAAIEAVVGRVRAKVAGAEAAGGRVRWVRLDGLHVTLRFLGEITERQLQQALALPEREQLESFSLRVEGLGAFPGLRNPRIVWAGVTGETLDDLRHLEHLQKRTERWARDLGLPPENKRYTSHVTLGRPRRPFENLRELMDDVAAREFRTPPVRIDELHLVRSTLAPGGSIYTTIGHWALRAGAGS